jgi:hypothetical protein
MTLEAHAETSEAIGGLPGVEVLMGSTAALSPGQAFRPTDPVEEAQANALPTGLREALAEDLDGLEEERGFASVATEQPLTAVDASVVKLGYTADGLVGVVRASAVTHHPDGAVELRRYRPGVFCLNSSNRLGVLHAMGAELGREDFYVELAAGKPVREKVKVGPHDHRLLDRARNYIERLVQRKELERIASGILAIDGALTMRTFDTPGVFIRRLHDSGQERDVSLVAVAKKTGLSIRGVDIRLLLDREGGLPGQRKLTPALRRENGRQGAERFLGDLYVARFTPAGETYRVDIDAAPGATSASALDEFVAGCLFRNGYPEPLLQAHAFSYMAPPVLAELQAYAVAKYQLVMRPEPNLAPVFAPFGGRYR